MEAVLRNAKKGERLIGRRDLLVAGAMALISALITYDAWIDIFRLGFVDEELSYVLLAPVVIGWLAWVRRDQLKDCPLHREWTGLLILLFGWLVFGYGYVTDPVLWRAGAVTIAVGAAASVLGYSFIWRFAPVFAACIFLIPVLPDSRINFAVPLQEATAAATQTICDLSGMYVDRSGNLLSINGVDVTVAEACNGMRMILTLFMVCYVVAFTIPLRPWMRTLFLLASPLVAIVANVVRLVPAVWIFGLKYAEAAEKFHDVSGWVMTVLAFLLLMGFAKLMQGLMSPTDDTATAAVPARDSKNEPELIA